MNKPIEDGGPAFPSSVAFSPMGDRESSAEYGLGGMSLREWYAGLAMQAILINRQSSINYLSEDASQYAKNAFIMADAMIKAEHDE